MGHHQVTTSTSVLGVTFDSGVMIAADTAIFYFGMARFRNQKRIIRVNDYTIGASNGDFADHQYLAKVIDDLQTEEETSLDGNKYSLSPLALHTWLTRVLYNRRSKFDPLFTNWIIGGIMEETGKPFLGSVDSLGTAYTDNLIATGMGSYIATPMMRKAVEAKNGQPLTESEARNLLAKCMQVLYSCDCRSWPKYHVAVVRKDAQGKVTSTIEDALEIDVDWTIADHVHGY